MATVHYFQRYSQRENVDTNNTLLLLARLQAHDPRILSDVLEELLSDAELDRAGFEIGAQFSQQTAGPSSVPDGMVYQSSFRILIETKRHDHFDAGQLEAHLKAFGNESTKILLLLAPVRFTGAVKGAKERSVHVVSRMFSDIIAACHEAGLHENLDLREIVDDYERFCHESGLISNDADRLMVVTVGDTLHENIDLRLYYTPSDRGYRKHAFLGLYTNKAVRAIGEVENIVTADLAGNGLKLHESTFEVTSEQQNRIKRAIASAPEHNWNISRGHTFFLVRQFIETHYEKASHGGLRGKRYFSMRQSLRLSNNAPLPTVEKIAHELRHRKWE